MRSEIEAMLAELSDAELAQLQIRVKEIIKEREAQKIAEAKQQIAAIAAGLGMPVQQILAGPKNLGKSRVGVTKYRNPANPSQVWSGLGRRPNWVLALAAAGKLDDAAI